MEQKALNQILDRTKAEGLKHKSLDSVETRSLPVDWPQYKGHMVCHSKLFSR